MPEGIDEVLQQANGFGRVRRGHRVRLFQHLPGHMAFIHVHRVLLPEGEGGRAQSQCNQQVGERSMHRRCVYWILRLKRCGAEVPPASAGESSRW